MTRLSKVGKIEMQWMTLHLTVNCALHTPSNLPRYKSLLRFALRHTAQEYAWLPRSEPGGCVLLEEMSFESFPAICSHVNENDKKS